MSHCCACPGIFVFSAHSAGAANSTSTHICFAPLLMSLSIPFSPQNGTPQNAYAIASAIVVFPCPLAPEIYDVLLKKNSLSCAKALKPCILILVIVNSVILSILFFLSKPPIHNPARYVLYQTIRFTGTYRTKIERRSGYRSKGRRSILFLSRSFH